MRRTSLTNSGSLAFWATPIVRRTPLSTSPTTKCLVDAGEFSYPAASCALVIDVSRREIVPAANPSTAHDVQKCLIFEGLSWCREGGRTLPTY